MIRTTLLAASAIALLSGCNDERKQSDAHNPVAEPHTTHEATTGVEPEASQPKSQQHNELPFAANIVAYYREKQNDELAACKGSGIKLQSDHPHADCYDKLDAAFIKPRIIYQNKDVALLSTKNMFGMGQEKEFGVELISLKKGEITPLWGALGSDFRVDDQADTVHIHYKTTEYSQVVEKEASISYQ